jgi:hypothetical protein
LKNHSTFVVKIFDFPASVQAEFFTAAMLSRIEKRFWQRGRPVDVVPRKPTALPERDQLERLWSRWRPWRTHEQPHGLLHEAKPARSTTS